LAIVKLNNNQTVPFAKICNWWNLDQARYRNNC